MGQNGQHSIDDPAAVAAVDRALANLAPQPNDPAVIDARSAAAQADSAATQREVLARRLAVAGAKPGA
jgi:hypothetical protein